MKCQNRKPLPIKQSYFVLAALGNYSLVHGTNLVVAPNCVLAKDNMVDLHWDDGIRYGTQVTTLEETKLTVRNGTGSDLPVEGTELKVVPHRGLLSVADIGQLTTRSNARECTITLREKPTNEPIFSARYIYLAEGSRFDDRVDWDLKFHLERSAVCER